MDVSTKQKQWDYKIENLIKYVQQFTALMEFGNSNSNANKAKMCENVTVIFKFYVLS